jgi:AraC-like DNA-binding protein
MSTSHQIKHAIASLRAPLRYIEDHSISLDHCLIGTGISRYDLEKGNFRIRLTQAVRFYQNLWELSEDPFLGITLGSQYRLADYGMWGFALMSARNLHRVLELAMRLVALSFTGFRHEIVEDGALTVHRLTPLLDYGSILTFMSDRELSAIHQIYCELAHGTSPIIKMDFVHDGGSTPSRYRQHFDCPVNFNCSRNEYVMKTADLYRTTSNTSRESEELCVQQCELLISRLSKRSNLVDDVRYMILSRPGEFLDIDSVARKMKMSARTLRRHLSEQNTSYQALLNEIRYGLAKDYLLTTNFKLHQISDLLGYNEPGNFTHAFKRWSGMSPREYRIAYSGNEEGISQELRRANAPG